MDAGPPEKPRLLVVRFTKTQFMSLTPPERELLIRVGLGINDMLQFQRLWAALFFRAEARSEAAQAAHAVQSTAVLLVLIGKLFEAVEIFDKFFLSTTVAREYLPLFVDGQKAAVKELKRFRGDADNLLARIRNDFAFHYLHDTPLSGYIEGRPDDLPLALYMGDPDGNTLSAFAAEALLSSLLALTGEPVIHAAIQRIQTATGNVLQPYITFANAVQIVALRKMLGPLPVPVEVAIADDEFLPGDRIALPFFMGKPSRVS